MRESSLESINSPEWEERTIMMKKIGTVCFLTAAMLLSLVGCGTKQEPEPTVTPDAEVTQTPEVNEKAAELTALLDEIETGVQPGAAGCSLRAVSYGVDLLNWSMDCTLSQEEVKAAVVAWLVPKGNDEQVQIAQSLREILNAFPQLMSQGNEDLLDDAGCRDRAAAYPWTEEQAACAMAVFEAAGVEASETAE